MINKTLVFIRLVIFFAIFLAGCKFSLIYNENYSNKTFNDSKSPLLAEVLMHLQLDYYDQEKLDPKILLSGAITEVERIIPEIWIYPKLNLEGKEESLNIVFGSLKTLIPIPELNSVLDLQNVLQRLLNELLQRDLSLSRLEIEYAFINGILNKLDEHSVLLPSQVFRDFNINIDGYFAGVGLVVGMREGYLTVISPIDGGPASRAGIKPLDRIVAVDNEKTEHLTIEEILQRLRGNLGTNVYLSVIRKGNTNTLNFDLKREEIRVKSVEKFDLKISGQTYRYIRIKNFQIGTSEELKNIISDLEGIEGLILDLRNNPGGLLEEAVKISDIFLPLKHRIVSTKGPSISKTYEAKKLFLGEFLEKIPLTVLINKGSASASEIVAASLKQNGRAFLIGERSYGKGTIQTLWNLGDGSGLKLTIGEYLTPFGNSIQSIGIEPSILLIPKYISDERKNFEEISPAEDFVREWRFKLIQENELFRRSSNIPMHSISYLIFDKNKLNNLKIVNANAKVEKLKSDIFIQASVIALKYKTKEKIKSDFKKYFSKLQFQENRKIIKKLSEFGIDWNTKGLENEKYNEELIFKWRAEQISPRTLSLNVDIYNGGDREVSRLIAVTKASNVLLDGLEFPIGKIFPGESRSQKVIVKFVNGMMEETEPVEMILFDKNRTILRSLRKKLKFSPKRNLKLKLNTKIFDNGKFGSKGNGDGKIQSGETIALSFNVVNLGKEEVPEFLLKIQGSHGDFRISRGKITLRNFAPGVLKKDFFLFKKLNNSSEKSNIKLEMIDTKSGTPKILRNLHLSQIFNEQEEFIPQISFIKFYDKEGKLLEGEANFNLVKLHIEVLNSPNLYDLYVHLNGKKVFYSLNENKLKKINEGPFENKKFLFLTDIELDKGENKISVFARNLEGAISEKRKKIILVD